MGQTSADRRRYCELLRLVQAELEGEASDAEIARLDLLIREDAQSRGLVVAILHDAHHLRMWAESRQVRRNVLPLELAESIRSESSQDRRGNSGPNFWRRTNTRFYLLVASVVVVFWIAQAFLLQPRNKPGEAELDVAQTPGITKPIARVVAFPDARFAPSSAVQSGVSEMKHGDNLSLVSGKVRVTFERGADVAIEGPATFSAVSANEGRLDAGKLSARVDKRAHGFTVRSPHVDVIDLGTRFSLFVNERGAEVQVDEGKVSTQVIDPTGEAARSIDMVAGEALRIEPNAKVTSIAPRSDFFPEIADLPAAKPPAAQTSQWKTVYEQSFDGLDAGARTGTGALQNWRVDTALGTVVDSGAAGKVLCGRSVWRHFNQGPIIDLDLSEIQHTAVRVRFDLITFGAWCGDGNEKLVQENRLVFQDTAANPAFEFAATFSTNSACEQSWPSRHKQSRHPALTGGSRNRAFEIVHEAGNAHVWPVMLEYETNSPSLSFAILSGSHFEVALPFAIDNVRIEVKATLAE